MNRFEPLGAVINVQVQASSLKVGEGRRTHYDPSPLRAGRALLVERDLVHADDGAHRWLDVHCAGHPQSRNRGNGDMLSIGFTGHYDAMRARFGAHLTNAIASENILVESDGVLQLFDLERGLRIVGADGRTLDFSRVEVAHPCVEFSRFCLSDDDAPGSAIKQTLRVLDGGLRGFYCFIDDGLPFEIRVGDQLYAVR
jgi:hypothetical protein